MKTDIEIAQEAELKPIKEVAASIGIKEMIWNCTENIRRNLNPALWMK